MTIKTIAMDGNDFMFKGPFLFFRNPAGWRNDSTGCESEAFGRKKQRAPVRRALF